ncbi:hypothetical protein [Jiangella asiatica]|uniref:Uncharacterized protein n=1 Tax=Jiangella asiatica TaxID=2530372 RepID=A0A4R5DAJ7_9ACTN|nr:hypothetical protein [Jiangella asiatica]TDE10656.1 hypothetical protein E1269_11320 [Jiangella asiatica]
MAAQLDHEPDVVPLDAALSALRLVVVVDAKGQPYVTRSSLAAALRQRPGKHEGAGLVASRRPHDADRSDSTHEL